MKDQISNVNIKVYNSTFDGADNDHLLVSEKTPLLLVDNLAKRGEEPRFLSTILSNQTMLLDRSSSSNSSGDCSMDDVRAGEDGEKETLLSSQRMSTSVLCCCHNCIEPFLDSAGSLSSVCSGLVYLSLLGIIIGCIMPKNFDLPSQWYRYTSSILGYTNFVFWCVSFYPQIIMNHKRRSTEGLSADFVVINFIGYVCYAIYTSSLYWNGHVREMYQVRHSDERDAVITVQSNDVAFSLHAVAFSGIYIYQLFIYGGLEFNDQHGRGCPISPVFKIINLLIVSSIILYGAMIICLGGVHPSVKDVREFIPERSKSLEWISSYFNWLDFIYYLSFVKVFVTLSKYMPQVILNARRGTCEGWSIWNVILDFSGALLSFAQLIGDASNVHDYTSITGNIAKLALSMISVGYNATFLLQHYILFPSHKLMTEVSQGGQELELMVELDV